MRRDQLDIKLDRAPQGLAVSRAPVTDDELRAVMSCRQEGNAGRVWPHMFRHSSDHYPVEKGTDLHDAGLPWTSGSQCPRRTTRRFEGLWK
jgi:hypothetical protein